MADPETDLCQLCEKRRPRRHCPGVRGDICPLCCGEAREVTVDCPLECEHLRDARVHERTPEPRPGEWPNREIRVSESFLRENESLLGFTARSLVDFALATPGVVDADVREALECMIRTLLTRESGLIYETRPNNPYAGGVQRHLTGALDTFRREFAERTGISSIRDKDVLGVLVFFQRLEYQYANGRRRGRAYLDFLASGFLTPGSEAGSSLVVP